MKILNFCLDISLIQNNQSKLADSIKLFLHQSNEILFNQLDFDNDSIFLEPALFNYFFQDDRLPLRTGLEQILFGYLNNKTIVKDIPVYSDSIGIINLPNWGYIKEGKNKAFNLSYDEKTNACLIDSTVKAHNNHFCLENSNLKMCVHLPDIFFYHSNNGNAVDNLTLHYTPLLEKVCKLIKDFDNSFYQLLSLVVRNIFVFNSTSINSFATIKYHGAAFFNIENQTQDEIFFIDDIAHQCGHIIFNALTFESTSYLTVLKETPLKNIIPFCNDKRSVYTVFHALFTYICILHCLNGIITSSNLTNIQRQSINGRIGFYLEKFRFDLELFDKNKAIFTNQGLLYYLQFENSYSQINSLYQQIVSNYTYKDQRYTFNSLTFLKENKLN